MPSLKNLVTDPDFEVVSVLSQPDRPAGRGKKLSPSPVKICAQELGIFVQTPESVKEIIPELKEQALDLAVVVAYGQILPKSFLESFSLGAFNIHSSRLPRWRGAAPMQRALMAGDKISGVSLQKIVPKLDAGDVVAEKSLEIPIAMGFVELHDQLSQMGAQLLIEDLKAFLKGDRQAQPQDESQVTYAKKIEKTEANIDWGQAAVDIHNLIRALNGGGPFAQTRFRNKSLKIHKSLPLQGSGNPGEVLELGNDFLTVGCGQGALKVLMVQPESKAKMAAADFLRGYQLKIGEQLG